MSAEIVVYGAGGHGKVIADIIRAMGLVLAGFIDDDASVTGTRVLGLHVLPAGDWLQSHSGAQVALGIGDNRAREKAATRIKGHGARLLTAIHPSAIAAPSVQIGVGVAIMAAAVLNPDCQIGEGTIVNTGTIVEHDAVIGRYAHLSPNCALGGGAQIGNYSHIGMSASVLPLKHVGNECTIGAGAVVVDDIPEGQIAYGVPARVRGSK